MTISSTVIPGQAAKIGIKGETTFGTLLDSDGTDTQAYRQLPMVQAPKPTFNILRESRLLSGRGSVKNAADTITVLQNGTVTCPFDFIATPNLLLQHLAMVTNTYNADGSDIYTVEVDGSNNSTSIGGTISSGIPHTVNLAYTPASSQGITVPGCTVSDLTISGDYTTNGGSLNMSGNYFSGFANTFSSSGTGTLHEVNHTGTWVYPDANVFINMGSLSTKQFEVDGNDQDMILKSFSLTISNGVSVLGGNGKGGAEFYSFPEYTVTGSLTFKHDGEFSLGAGANVLQTFLDGNTCTLSLKFGDGTVSSVGELNLDAECQFTGDPTQDISEQGLFWTVPFECVQNTTTEALKISMFSDEAIAAM